MRLAVTGGAGFIGANFVQHVLRERTGWRVTVIDKLTYAGNLRNLDPCRTDERFRFVRLDICDAAIGDVLGECDAVAHLAAETHVDRSLEDDEPFFRTNLEGTSNLLAVAQRCGVQRFLHVSTDEIYGPIAAGRADERAPFAPTSPYAQSKAEADRLVHEFVATHGFPAVIARCSNNYGPYQFPEKFIPLMIAQALDGQPLPLYGDGLQVRDWLHVEDCCRALLLLLEQGRTGEAYNVGGGAEITNREVAQYIARAVDRPESLIESVADRPRHDRRYALDCGKIKAELGWTPRISFGEGLATTIAWYRENAEWLAEARGGEYRAYYERHYTRREQTLSSRA